MDHIRGSHHSEEMADTEKIVPEVQEFSDASHEVGVDRYVTTWKATNSRNSQIIQFECRFPTFFLSPIVANRVEKQREFDLDMFFLSGSSWRRGLSSSTPATAAARPR